MQNRCPGIRGPHHMALLLPLWRLPPQFCGNCGSPIGLEADHYPDDMQLYTATTENPSNFRPTFHVT